MPHAAQLTIQRLESRPQAQAASPGKARLDVLLVERGLAPSRERAQAILLAGQVRVNGAKMEKAGSQVAADARIEIVGETLRYASRGGLKLEGALEDFGVEPRDRICLDVGSSTGGFTDCLLQRGARKVYRGRRDHRPARLEAAAGRARRDGRAERALSARRRHRRAAEPDRDGRVVHFRDQDSAGDPADCAGQAPIF